ncbi:MAG: hypothetical protein ACXADB_05365 [Candidatus Hermodarchaeia archaeon]
MAEETTFAQDIEKAAGGERIIKIVVSAHKKFEKYGKMLSWDEARPLLDYHYDKGYGCEDCHAIYAWTTNRIIVVHEYDGSTGVYWIPRNPVNIDPEFC